MDRNVLDRNVHGSKRPVFAVKEKVRIGGRWSDVEAKNHISCLELMAALFGLQAFWPNVANPTLVFEASTPASGCTTCITTAPDYIDNARETRGNTSLNQENAPSCMQIIRESYKAQGFSTKATSIILQSWRRGTTKPYIKRWSI